MSDPNTSIATQAAARAMEFQQRMMERIRDEFSAGIGYEKVTNRKVRGLARKVVENNDPQAMAEINLMAIRNGHERGKKDCPCPVCREVNHVLAEKKGKEPKQEAISW